MPSWQPSSGGTGRNPCTETSESGRDTDMADPIVGQNFARQNPDVSFVTFNDCNFSQDEPGTVMIAMNCVFNNCNLVNCVLDSSNTLNDCNMAQVAHLDG